MSSELALSSVHANTLYSTRSLSLLWEINENHKFNETKKEEEEKESVSESYALHLLAKLCALLVPTLAASCPICLCMLESSTVSLSRRPSVPRPLAHK